MQLTFTRRQVLLAGGAALASLALRTSPVAASSAAMQPINAQPANTQEDTMPKKVLIAYATRAGSTREIAQRMAATLQAKGMQTTVVNAKKCKSVEGYDAVIVGSGVRMGRVYGEATRLVKRNSEALAAVPTAFFGVSLGAKETDAETVAAVESHLDVLEELVTPVASADFAGSLEIDKLGPIFRWTMSKAAESDDGMQEGDYRDWDAIQAWTAQLF